MNDDRINSREIKRRLQEQILCDSKCICWKTDLSVFMCKGKLPITNICLCIMSRHLCVACGILEHFALFRPCYRAVTSKFYRKAKYISASSTQAFIIYVSFVIENCHTTIARVNRSVQILHY